MTRSRRETSVSDVKVPPPSAYWDGPEMIEYLRSLPKPTWGDEFVLMFLESRARARDRVTKLVHTDN